jgi:pimeloyl-ACP methyl ester carboxylesterase
MSDYVSDVVAVLDHIESKGAVLVGFSTGGDISLELARLHPDRVLGVVGIAATAKQYKISGEELAYQVVNLQTDGILPFVAALERNWVLPPWMKDILVQNDPLALSAARIGWQVWDGLDGKLNEIDVPCLFIAGERDDLIEDVRTTAEQIKESTLIELKQCDHIQTFLELDRVVEQLRDFMRLCFGRTVGG